MSVKALKQAKYEAEYARRKFDATLVEIQQRLQPATLTNNAWEGVKDKGSEIASEAVQAVKERPIAVSAALAAFTLFLARAPIKSAVSRLISGPDPDNQPGGAPAERNSRNDLTPQPSAQ